MISLLLQISTAPPTGENAVDFTWLFVKMLLVLGIVSIGAVLILKYGVPHTGVFKKFHRSRHFKIIDRCILESGRSIYLVEACKKYLVIGSAERGINLITEIPESDVRSSENT